MSKTNARRPELNPAALLILVAFLTATAAAPAWSFERVEHVGDLSAGIDAPGDLAISVAGDLHVLDRAHRKVVVFDRTLSPLTAFGRKGNGPGMLDEPWGIAVSPAGNVIVGDAGNGLVHIFDRNGDPIAAFGGKGEAPGRLARPTRVLTDAFGMIYVGDTANHTISLFSESGIFLDRLVLADFHSKARLIDFAVDSQANVYALLMPEGKILVARIGSDHPRWIAPQGEAFLHHASGIAVDQRGDLYITVSKEHSIKKLDPSGSLLLAFGSKGKGPGQFIQPTRVAVDPDGRLAVIDSRNRRVQVLEVTGSTREELKARPRSLPTVRLAGTSTLFDGVTDLHRLADGSLLALSRERSLIVRQQDQTTVIGKPGKGSGEFSGPRAFATTSRDGIAVADTENNRVQLVGPDGRFSDFGKQGRKPGRFDSPQGVAVSSEDLIYVADTGNHRVQIFSGQGIFLASFGEKSREKTVEYGTFNRPTDLAIDSKDRVHVVDSGNQRVQVFDSKGRFLWAIDSLWRPVDIAIDERDNIYIGDAGCNCVKIYHPTGVPLMSFGSSGAGEGAIPELSALAVGNGKVHVASAGVEQLQVFDVALSGLAGKSADRLDVTQAYFVPDHVTAGSPEIESYRAAAFSKALEQLAAQLESSTEILRPLARIDAETPYGNREYRLTVSIPRNVPRMATASSPETDEESAEFELK